MRGNFSLILSDNIIRISFYSSLAIIILQCILLSVTFNRLPPLIPFLNSQPWGVGRLYESWVVFIINNFLSLVYYRANTLASRILSFNAFLFILLGFLAYIQIVLLVF